MTVLSRPLESPARRFTWAGPLFMLFARFLFALLFQGLTALPFSLRGDPMPFQSAARWWTVYGSLIDIACLISITFLLRSEGLKISSLIDFNRTLFWKDIRTAFGLMFLFLMIGFGGGTLAGILIYGGPPPAAMEVLPLWGALYSLIIWPVLWGFTEQLTYQGYVLPRLQSLSESTWLTVLVLGFGYAFQHTALPLILDLKFILFRFLSSLPFIIMFPVYLRAKRLAPFMIAHWIVDALSVAVTIFMS